MQYVFDVMLSILDVLMKSNKNKRYHFIKKIPSIKWI